MIDTILRGFPYYVVFILLFIIYREYNRLLFRQRRCKKDFLYKKELVYEKKRKRTLLFAYILLLFFFGFRGYVYTDFVNYKSFFEMFDGFNNLSEIFIIKGWEPGFIIYTALCKILIPNYFAWNVISTLIDLLLLYKILERYSNNHMLSLMVFFIIGSTALEFNVLRNAKAIFLFLYALKYIEERKMWKYFSIISLASLFHISSIFYFPLYFILHRRWPQWILWGIYIGGIVILFFHIEFVSYIVSRIFFSEDSRIGHLVGHLEYSEAYSSLFGNIERLITMLIVIMLYDNLARNRISNYMYINMYVFLYASFTFFSESSVMVQRFQYMFIASFWFLYPLIIDYAKTNKKMFVYLFITALIFMKLLIIAEDPNLRYENVLTGVSDFHARENYVEYHLGK